VTYFLVILLKDNLTKISRGHQVLKLTNTKTSEFMLEKTSIAGLKGSLKNVLDSEL